MMPDNTRTVPVYVIERRNGEKELAARGFGWPEHEEPAKLNQHFVEEMRRLKGKVDLSDHSGEDQVAEMIVRTIDHEITEVNIIAD